MNKTSKQQKKLPIEAQTTGARVLEERKQKNNLRRKGHSNNENIMHTGICTKMEIVRMDKLSDMNQNKLTRENTSREQVKYPTINR
jgi:hypothetical protein